MAPDVGTQTAEVAAGAHVLVRDEEWLVRSVCRTERGELRIDVTGTSEWVRDQDAVFFDSLDEIVVPDPHDTRLVPDTSPGFRRSRLWLESLLRRSATPSTDTRIVSGHRGLADTLDYQLRPAHRALSNLRPRILLGDAAGLGKTPEIGITLTELIARGRGERILVVTPRTLVEQFRHDLGTRYAIPLARLDSDGVRQGRRARPGSHRHTIVSLETLQNPTRSRRHLVGRHWDVVVIDECQHLGDPGGHSNELIRLLAQQTDALILSGNTPYHGDPEAFAELVDLLDPTAIADPRDYGAEDIDHLYVRRHRHSPGVRDEVGPRWARRRAPRVVSVTPTPQEHAVLEELRDVWLHPPSGRAPGADTGCGPDPWTLFRSFLSSPDALRADVGRRLTTLDDHGNGGNEAIALTRLDELAAAAQRHDPAKLDALVHHLRGIGISRRSRTRVVVFADHVATLEWLRRQLCSRLNLPGKAVAVLHAQLPGQAMRDVRTDVERPSGPVRVLLAGDGAGEGTTLHHRCHRVVHYDLPWSPLRIQRRHGRIDRYHQDRPPQITALALTADDPSIANDLRVIPTLLEREHAAGHTLGDAGALLDRWDEQGEEDTVTGFLREGRDPEEAVPEPDPEQLSPLTAFLTTGGQPADAAPVPIAPRRAVFDTDDAFLADALAEIGVGAPELWHDETRGMLAFDVPEDLAAWLADLPARRPGSRGTTGRLRLSAPTPDTGHRSDEADRDGGALRSDAGHLAPAHPVLEWATIRALARFGSNRAPVMVADVAEPVFLTWASWANGRGQPVVTHWGAITGLPDEPEVAELWDVLDAAGLGEHAPDPDGTRHRVEQLRPLVPAAVQAAARDLHTRRAREEDVLLARLEEHRKRLDAWEHRALTALETRDPSGTGRERVRRTRDAMAELIDSHTVVGEPFVRVIGLIVPRGHNA